MAKGGVGREGMMQSDSEEEELEEGGRVFSCEMCIPPDAVVTVSRAAWLLGAVPWSLMARTSKL